MHRASELLIAAAVVVVVVVPDVTQDRNMRQDERQKMYFFYFHFPPVQYQSPFLHSSICSFSFLGPSMTGWLIFFNIFGHLQQ